MSLLDKQIMLRDLRTKLEVVLKARDVQHVLAIADEIMADYDVQSVSPGGWTDSEDLLRFFLDAKRAEGKSPKTIEHYRRVLGYLQEKTGVTYQRMTVYHIREYITRERERGISPSTLNGYRSVFSSFFGWLAMEELIDRNPMNNLTTIKQPKIKRKPYTAAEQARIMEAAESARDKALIAFLASTGCRVGEVAGADWTSIDWDNQSIIVRGKGDKERIVYMDDVAAMLVERYVFSREDDCPALFLGRGGVRLGIGGIEKILKKTGKAAGVDNVHPHRFRRTLASGLIKKGMPIQEVKQILGHEKIDTTMTYVTVSDRDVAERYRRLA